MVSVVNLNKMMDHNVPCINGRIKKLIINHKFVYKKKLITRNA